MTIRAATEETVAAVSEEDDKKIHHPSLLPIHRHCHGYRKLVPGQSDCYQSWWRSEDPCTRET